MASAKASRRRSRPKMSGPEIMIVCVFAVLAAFIIFLMAKTMINRPSYADDAGYAMLEYDLNEYVLRDDAEKLYENSLDIPQTIDGQYSVLLLGLDESLDADVVILFLIDICGRKMDILQIPRDTYVGSATPGTISSLYSDGDSSVLPINRVVSSVRKTLCLPVDSYVTVNCSDISAITDALGGVTANVPSTFSYPGNHIIYEGQQLLNGIQSEHFLRFKSGYSEGDIGRIKAQRTYLAFFMQKIQETGSQKCAEILPLIREHISSDLSAGEMNSLLELICKIDTENVNIHMLCGEGVVYNDCPVWSIHSDAAIKLLNENFRPYQADVEDLPIYQLSDASDWYDFENNNFGDLLDGELPEIGKK